MKNRNGVIGTLRRLGGGHREQAGQPEAQKLKLAFGGTHGGALPHPKAPGDFWFFNAGFGYRGPTGLLIVYGRVGHGGTLSRFNMEDLWQTASTAIFATERSSFGEIGTSSRAVTVPDVPGGTYDAEAELWYFPATLEQARQQTQQGDFLPKTLAGARASADGIFLARDNDQSVYEITHPVLRTLAIGVRVFHLLLGVKGVIVTGPFPSDKGIAGDCDWVMRTDPPDEVLRKVSGIDLRIIGGEIAGPTCQNLDVFT